MHNNYLYFCMKEKRNLSLDKFLFLHYYFLIFFLKKFFYYRYVLLSLGLMFSFIIFYFSSDTRHACFFFFFSSSNNNNNINNNNNFINSKIKYKSFKKWFTSLMGRECLMQKKALIFVWKLSFRRSKSPQSLYWPPGIYHLGGHPHWSSRFEMW